MTGSWNDFNDAQNTSVIPKGVIAKGRLTIRPGGYDDPAQGWTGGYATAATAARSTSTPNSPFSRARMPGARSSR